MSIELLPEDLLERFALGDVEPTVDLEEFFDPAFMREHTDFDRLAAFWAASPWTVDDRADLEAVSAGELDDYVARRTEFDSWVAMRNAAAEDAVVERLMA